MFDPTFDDLEQIALGEIGLKVGYFYRLTSRQFNNILIGYRRKEEEATKIKMILNRDLEFMIAAPNLSEKDREKGVQGFKPLPWEKEEEEVGRVFKTPEELKLIRFNSVKKTDKSGRSSIN